MSARDRTLPLRVAIAEGEAFDSWLVRFATRNSMSVLRLAGILGLTERINPWRHHSLVRAIPAELLRRIEARTGLSPSRLDLAVLDRFDPLEWDLVGGSRYCAACLAESGTQWRLCWQLPFVFACTRHKRLLTVECPACGIRPHSRYSGYAGRLALHQCAIIPTRGDEACGADLLAVPAVGLPSNDPRLAVQRWIDQRLEAMDAAAIRDLRDLGLLADWVGSRLRAVDVPGLGPDTIAAIAASRRPRPARGWRRHYTAVALVTAAAAVHAVGIINSDGDDRYQRLSVLFKTNPEGPKRLSTARTVLTTKRFAQLSDALRTSILHACDPYLPLSERLRFHTGSHPPRLPDPETTQAHERSRHLPQYLWHDWIVRFLPPQRPTAHAIATAIPIALFLPGNPTQPTRITSEFGPWTRNTSEQLNALAKRHPDVLRAICSLADYLDRHGSPIDYRRRRRLFTDVELSWSKWEELCRHSGTTTGGPERLLQVRRYLFQLLTGADLHDPRHTLAFHTAISDREHYISRFQYGMPSALRASLQQLATQMLHQAGIDEPLTWSPPASCASGLDLPGRDPADIDTEAIHELINIDHKPARTVAHELGVSIEHVRFAMQRIDRPLRLHLDTPEALPPGTLTRADRLLTDEFFDRERTQGNKSFREIAAQTGLPYRVVIHFAHQR